MAKISIIILAILLFCCNPHPTIKSENNNESSAIENASVNGRFTHLHDSIIIHGNSVLFLLPDSARIESYNEDSGIYDADADFGVGISNTMDSLSKNAKYKNIKAVSTSRRYILINDCNKCPMLLDRDTVNYGIIFSSKERSIRTIYNEVHSGDYLQDVDRYFEIK